MSDAVRHVGALLCGPTTILRRCSPSKGTAGLMQRKTDDETGASGWFSPYVAAVVANSLTREREPKSQPILLPGGEIQSGILGPVSSNSTSMHAPTFLAPTRTFPQHGIASIAFTMRLKNTRSMCERT